MEKNRFDLSLISTRVEFEKLIKRAKLAYNSGQNKTLISPHHGKIIIYPFFRERFKSGGKPPLKVYQIVYLKLIIK